MWESGGMKGGSHQVRDERSISGWVCSGLAETTITGEISDLFKERIGNSSLEKSHRPEHVFPAFRFTQRVSEGRLTGVGWGCTHSSHCWPAQFLEYNKTFSSRKISFQSYFCQPKNDWNGWKWGDFSFPFLQARMVQLFELLFIVLTPLNGFSPNQSDKCHFSSFPLKSCTEQSYSMLAGQMGWQKGGFAVGPLYRRMLIHPSQSWQESCPSGHWVSHQLD